MTVETVPARARTGVWELAWPAVLTSLLQSMVGLVDAKVVGTLGADAMAAATAGHRVLFLLQAMLMALSAGTVALVARAFGARDHDEASRIAKSALVVGVALAAVTAASGLALADVFASAFGLAGEPARLTAIYIRWISGFNIVFAIGFVLAAGTRAAGDTRTPLWIGALTNIVNAFCLYLFVYGGLGVTSLGIAGAALAGGLAYTFGAALSFSLWARGKLPIRIVSGDLVDRVRIGRLLRVGYPAAIEQMILQFGMIAFTFIVARAYGTAALAAYGIGVQILSVSFVIGFGFSIAASTLVGQHLGAGDPARAAASGWRAVWLAVSSMSVLAVLIIALAKPIAQMMIDDPEVVRLTVAFIYLLGAVQPLMAIDFALAGALRGAGDTRSPLIATFAGLIGGRLVLALIFAWMGLPVVFVYGALLADYILKTILLVGRFRSNAWQHALPAPHAIVGPPMPAVRPLS